jgi:hypothetical protein
LRSGRGRAVRSKPARSTAAHNGHFPKEQFSYDSEADVYLCPAGERLSPRYFSKDQDPPTIAYCNRAACRNCQLRDKCTKSAYRQITRYQNEAILERMPKRLAARPELLDIKRESVEHPFGSIKQWMNQGAFLMRRLDNVRGEFSLTALAYNIRRAITLVGVKGLLARNLNVTARPSELQQSIRADCTSGHSGMQAGNLFLNGAQRGRQRKSHPPRSVFTRSGTFV